MRRLSEPQHAAICAQYRSIDAGIFVTWAYLSMAFWRAASRWQVELVPLSSIRPTGQCFLFLETQEWENMRVTLPRTAHNLSVILYMSSRLTLDVFLKRFA